MDVFAWLRSAFRHAPAEPAPATQLSPEQAMQIARNAQQTEVFRDILTSTSVRQRDGKLVWVVSSAVVGRSYWVEIDDQTREVLGIFSAGVR
jgi:Peptidase propeptide and YPEB domain